MLLIAKSLRELDFRQLMNVYQETAWESDPDLSIGQALLEAEHSFYAYLKDGFFVVPEAFYGIWVADGIYVSALRLEPYRDGWLLEAVETMPSQRRKGYAKLLMSQVLSRLGQGKVYSHIHKANTASIRLHEGFGFRRISDQAAYIDGSVDSRCATYLWESEESVWQSN